MDSDNPAFPRQRRDRIGFEVITQLAIHENHDHHHKKPDDRAGAEEQPLSEPHASFACTSFIRYPKPRTVSIRSPAGSSFVRKR